MIKGNSSPSAPKIYSSRNLLMRFILGGTTLIVSISAYFSYQAARKITLEDLRGKAFLEVQKGVDEIEEWLHVRKVEVQTIAQTSAVRSLPGFLTSSKKSIYIT